MRESSSIALHRRIAPRGGRGRTGEQLAARGGIAVAAYVFANIEVADSAKYEEDKRRVSATIAAYG